MVAANRKKRENYITGFLMMLAFIIMFLLGCYTGYNDAKDELKSEVILKDTCACNRDTLTLNNVEYKINKLDIKYPKIVYAQCILETAFLTSNVCQTKNNLFGFMTNEGYLQFDNWQESCQYYKNWQDRKYKGGDYYTFLKNLPYAGDTNYVNTLKIIVSKI